MMRMTQKGKLTLRHFCYLLIVIVYISATYFTNEESFVKGLITSSQRRRSYSPMKLRNTDSKKQRQYNVEDGVCIQNPMFATGNMQDMDAETRDIGKEEMDAVAVDANEVDMGDLQLDSTKSYYYHDFVDFEDALLVSCL